MRGHWGVHWSPPKHYDVRVARTTPTLTTSSIANATPKPVGNPSATAYQLDAVIAFDLLGLRE
jgi:hypothetical protein